MPPETRAGKRAREAKQPETFPLGGMAVSSTSKSKKPRPKRDPAPVESVEDVGLHENIVVNALLSSSLLSPYYALLRRAKVGSRAETGALLSPWVPTPAKVSPRSV